MRSPPSERRFQLILIKPSHYDDDGYVIRWWRAVTPVQFAGCGLRHRGGQCPAPGARPRHRHRHRADRRNQHAREHPRADRTSPSPWRFRTGGACRRAIQPVSARARHREAVPRGRYRGRHRRLPRLGVPVDAGRRRGRSRRLPRSRHFHVRRRGGRPVRPVPARCGRRPAEARLQLSRRTAGNAGNAAAVPAQAVCLAHHRSQHELRRGTRLSLSVLVLHHHQRPGPQVALPLARRHRTAGPPELGRRRQQILHHRRQFRAQPRMGSDLRPPDPAARGGHSARPDDPGRYAVPQAAGLRGEGQARRRDARVHRAGEHQSGQPRLRQEEAEQDHRIPQDAARLERRRASSRSRATSWDFRPTRRRPSAATSPSSRRNCRSTGSSSSA